MLISFSLIVLPPTQYGISFIGENFPEVVSSVDNGNLGVCRANLTEPHQPVPVGKHAKQRERGIAVRMQSVAKPVQSVSWLRVPAILLGDFQGATDLL